MGSTETLRARIRGDGSFGVQLPKAMQPGEYELTVHLTGASLARHMRRSLRLHAPVEASLREMSLTDGIGHYELTVQLQDPRFDTSSVAVVALLEAQAQGTEAVPELRLKQTGGGRWRGVFEASQSYYEIALNIGGNLLLNSDKKLNISEEYGIALPLPAAASHVRLGAPDAVEAERVALLRSSDELIQAVGVLVLANLLIACVITGWRSYRRRQLRMAAAN